MTDSDRTRQLPQTDPRAASREATAADPRTDVREGEPVDPRDERASRPGALVLDRYRLEHRIGRGGHGAVWEALDERLERLVAVKVIPRGEGSGSVGPRAEREGRVAARLNHPGIVGLYELGSDAEFVYLVSELVRGRTMAELRGAGALSDRDVCGIGIALCAALEHAHARGVIHRDVKPQNVIVVAEPAAGVGFAKLTDFGVAHVTDEETLTRTGDVVGTLAYMAPEQAGGDPVTAAADVYSLALILYEGWTGAGPDGAVSARLAGRPVAPLRRLRRDLPPALCEAIDAALDPLPAARPGLAELASELRATADALSNEGGLVEPATRRRFGIPSAPVAGARPLPTLPRWLPRAAAGIAAAALVAAALEVLAPPPGSLPALAVAVPAGALVALLPRIGWLLTAIAVLAWMASPEVGQPGTALVLAGALAPTPLLLPRAGTLWSAPALAPLLGVVGLATLFVALAGLAPTAWRRAGLAVAGFAWLVAAEMLSGEALLFGPATGTEASAVWEGSLVGAARDAVYPAVTSLALVPAVAWAVLAVLLGVAVRGRAPALDLTGAVVWAAAAVALHEWLAELLAGEVAAPEPGVSVAGAVLGAAAALGAAAWTRRRRSEQPFVP